MDTMRMAVKELLGFLSKKQEIIVIILFSLLALYYFTTIDVVNIYTSEKLNSLLMNTFGTLFGLLLTSYAILFGLIPALSTDTLETNALESVNFRFFASLLINLMIIVLGMVIIFSTELRMYAIYAQLFFVVYLIQMFFLLMVYLYLLFKGARNKILKDRQKRI